MNKTIHLFSHSDAHTTARYFLTAIKKSYHNVLYWTSPPDPSQINDDDIFFFIDPSSDWPIGLEKINCLTIAYFIDVHQNLKLRLTQSFFFDKVYLAQKDYVHYFESSGHHEVDWLPLACAPHLYTKHFFSRNIDVSFIGNFGAEGTYRYTTLINIQKAFPEHIVSKFTPPLDMVNVYQKSKIVFNISVNGDLNMRFFEAMASGALLISDRINNGLNCLFEENVHYIGYSSPEEAIYRINYYLQHEDERVLIANAGFSIVHKIHTYDNRWLKISSELNSIPSKKAPARFLNKKELVRLYSQIFTGIRMPIRSAQSILKYGVTFYGIYSFFYSFFRKLNQLIPITPKAIAFRIRSSKLK